MAITSGADNPYFRGLGIPNWISLARIPLAAAFAMAVRGPRLAIGILALAGATDVLDGWYARRFHQTTPAGAILDAVMDKTFVLAVIVSMLGSERLSIGEGLLLGARDLTELPLLVRWMALSRIRQQRRRRSANRLGKLATVSQFATVAALLLGSPYRAVWIALTALSGALSGIVYAVKELRGDEPRVGRH